MANPEHVAILSKAVAAWNAWQSAHFKIDPDLSGADLSNLFLAKAMLYKANLAGANLKRAFLAEAQLVSANLKGATLPERLWPARTSVLPISQMRTGSIPSNWPVLMAT